MLFVDVACVCGLKSAVADFARDSSSICGVSVCVLGLFLHIYARVAHCASVSSVSDEKESEIRDLAIWAGDPIIAVYSCSDGFFSCSMCIVHLMCVYLC